MPEARCLSYPCNQHISWDAAHGTTTPVVRRIDHVIIRVDGADESCFDECYALFADTLRLPTPWPPTEHPTMQRGATFQVFFKLSLINWKLIPLTPLTG